MIKNKQLIVDSIKGDCFRACVTSVLEIPNLPSLPNCDDPEWFLKWDRILRTFGVALRYEAKACWRSGYWIASVKSKNYKEVTHAIVMNGLRVAFDPSTKRRYHVGYSLLGKDVVNGGHYFEILDPSKLSKFEKYKNTLKKK